MASPCPLPRSTRTQHPSPATWWSRSVPPSTTWSRNPPPPAGSPPRARSIRSVSLLHPCTHRTLSHVQTPPCAVKQRRFTSLDGTTEAQGDLSSIVLHSLKVTHAKNGFPVSVGAKVFGVDHNSYAANGESFSFIRESCHSNHTISTCLTRFHFSAQSRAIQTAAWTASSKRIPWRWLTASHQSFLGCVQHLTMPFPTAT